MIEKPVVFHNEGMQLVGMLHLPEGVENPPGVVFFHGLTGCKTEAHWFFVKLARAFALKGIAVLRFDFRYSGESEGNFEDMTISGEISDALKALDYFITECDVSPERIGILGLSMGGAVAVAVAEKAEEKIKTCVLINPVGNPLEDVSGVAEKRDVKVGNFPIDYRSFLFGRKFFLDIRHIKSMESAQNVICPVLIVNAGADQTVPPKRSQDYFEVFRKKNPDSELYVIEEADHVFSTAAWEADVIRKISEWMQKNLF